ncbi:MFS transporter [Bailinhaonella thermotolerans]|uniref:DHA2 family efflux MFS transporter permease subunit n=1 Tax=Bailinhaonella thermotolerans TaxID=1070861 RepID=A0A3A4ALJ5_9ACTN|nr:MFS transporter [Bailinhaonella thermotolerans]RJL30496.1 DHA2 family efflux MFS transporter permease subunit [Bailinhaonella thermotolerans]
MERHPRRWLILIVLCLSTLVLVVDNGVLTVAIPSLTQDLGATTQDMQWIIDAYILVFAGLLLTAGSLSDRYGRRRIMIIGLIAFGIASALAAYAGTPGQLIAGRVLMGIGGALVMPSTLSILITVFDEQERRKAMGIWSSVLMVGLIGGPVVGGALIAEFWWGSVFLINVPVVVVAVIAAFVWMPESRGPWRKPDPLGAILSTAGLTALVWTIIALPQHGLTHPGTLVSAAVAVLGLAAFVVWELRTPYPMVPLGLFRNRNFSGGSLSLVLVQIGNGGLILGITQYLQFVLGYTPTQAGLALIPMAAAVILVNGVAAGLGQKVGNRPLTAAGLAVLAGGFGLLATLEPGDGFGMVAAALVLFGIGGGMAQPAATAALMGAVPQEHAGVGSALNDTVQQAGAALGVAILGSLLAGGYTDAMPADAPEAARRSIAGALASGDRGLIATAHEAFTGAMTLSFAAGAAGVLAAAVLSFVLIRDRGPGSAAPAAGEPVAAASH